VLLNIETDRTFLHSHH